MALLIWLLQPLVSGVIAKHYFVGVGAFGFLRLILFSASIGICGLIVVTAIVPLFIPGVKINL